jgi:hypothetical protein
MIEEQALFLNLFAVALSIILVISFGITWLIVIIWGRKFVPRVNEVRQHIV